MIFNNYRALGHIRILRDDSITPERILGLHRVLTLGTLDDLADAGVAVPLQSRPHDDGQGQFKWRNIQRFADNDEQQGLAHNRGQRPGVTSRDFWRGFS